MDIKQRLFKTIAIFSAISCVLIANSACAAASNWHVVSTPRFTLVSQLSEIKTRAWAAEFDQTYLIAATALWQKDARGSASDIAYLSRQAISYWPRYQEAYQTLSAAVRSLEQPSVEYIDLVKVGHQLFPLDGKITLGLAVALAKTDEPQQAIDLINNVLSDSLAATETIAQAQLIHSWILQNEYCPKIRALVKASKFSEALALANDFRSRSIDESARQIADAMRLLIEGTEQLQLIEVALRDEPHDQDKALAATILASNTPLALLKSTVHQNLQRRKK